MQPLKGFWLRARVHEKPLFFHARSLTNTRGFRYLSSARAGFPSERNGSHFLWIIGNWGKAEDGNHAYGEVAALHGHRQSDCPSMQCSMKTDRED